MNRQFCRPPELGDHHVDVRSRQFADRRLDLVGDVRHHLHGVSQVFAAPLFVNDAQVNAPGGEVGIFRQQAVGEPLVMPQVEIGLGSVVEDVHFAVLVRAHRPRIDVDVRIEFLHPHAQAAFFQEQPDRRGRQPLAQRTHNAAGDEYVLCHCYLS
jgi:hypothetical protein